jgi:hypothetical protein
MLIKEMFGATGIVLVGVFLGLRAAKPDAINFGRNGSLVSFGTFFEFFQVDQVCHHAPLIFDKATKTGIFGASSLRN